MLTIIISTRYSLNEYKTINCLELKPMSGAWSSGYKCLNCNQHGLGSKSTHAFLMYPWEDTLRYYFLLGSFGKQFQISVISLEN